jgi:uncharacterized iron-regulated membrane protein
MRVLEMSRPLHFGDYGGLPLKIIWAFLDVVTMIVLTGGVYLFSARIAAGISATPWEDRCTPAPTDRVKRDRMFAGAAAEFLR